MIKNRLSHNYIKCSISIFNPIITKITPPINAALDLYLAPKMFPIFTPPVEMQNVVNPMMMIAI